MARARSCGADRRGKPARPLRQPDHVGHAGRRTRDRGLRPGRAEARPAQLPGYRTGGRRPDRGPKGAHARKTSFAAAVRAVGLPLTLNMVVHRQNLEHLQGMIDMALALGARRLEIAHVQYYAWALINRDALLPSRRQLDEATALVAAAQARLKGVLAIDYVVPDYHGVRPKSCMNGWARRFLNITPSGTAVPCHAAETLPGIDFPSVRDSSLADIWYRSDAFNRFRGTDWMPEPCRELRPARDRLGRLPLPGLPADGRRQPRRSGLRPVARSRAGHCRSPAGGRHAAGSGLSPVPPG